MRYPPSLLDEIRARLPVSQVVGRRIALKKAGREYRGLSPFKVEKTPSFFVNDQKGFYHCFASGEHGDIFTFLMKTEGLQFTEAVERLAAEAGVPLPKPDRRSVEREDQRARLYRLLEDTTAFFEAQLAGPGGIEARRYLLEKRKIERATIANFRLGYAPAGRNALREHLAGRGYTSDDMAEAGVLISGPDIAVPYDRFRHRVIFPISDLKGRVIAFGGRALAADAPAKYLNSPETPLFHKGANLYNAHRARPLAHERKRIVVVEGYMDVVALVEAGIGEAVAPLGTALTEDQVKLLWRIVPEPTLCFDGDSAGRKAAYRAVDTVLPHLQPGTSVNFAFLPDGLDPDDLLRQSGPEALRETLANVHPLSQVLFDRWLAAGDWSTPERRAALTRSLNDDVRRIGDATVRALYQADVEERLARHFGRTSLGASSSGRRPYGRPGLPSGSAAHGYRGGPPSPNRWNAAPQNIRPVAGPALKQSRLASSESMAATPREALILLGVLVHPWLITEHAEELSELEFAAPALGRLRDAMVSAAGAADGDDLTSEALAAALAAQGFGSSLDGLKRTITHRADKFALADTAPEDVLKGWRQAVALQQQQVSLQRALTRAQAEYDAVLSEDAYLQIADIKQQLAALAAAESEGSFG